jgi:SAM-dependent methyltransferase
VVRDGLRYRLAEGVLPFTQSPLREGMMGHLRTNLMQALALLDAPVGEWRHTSRALLQSQGDASSVLAPMMKGMIAPHLDGLAARLEQPGARFLDVGVGVAALAIAVCRAFPALRVVGIDSSDTPLSIARENVANAGLGDRVELRRTSIGDLADEGAFDLAWLPSFFVDTAQLRTGVARVHAALRPGGWIICATDSEGNDDRDRATWALVRTAWGGADLGSAAAEEALAEAGFTSVRTLSLPPTAPAMVVGRR